MKWCIRAPANGLTACSGQARCHCARRLRASALLERIDAHLLARGVEHLLADLPARQRLAQSSSSASATMTPDGPRR
jgi:hypothetical protein